MCIMESGKLAYTFLISLTRILNHRGVPLGWCPGILGTHDASNKGKKFLEQVITIKYFEIKKL
jgi:hypothetical protein